MAHCCQAWRPLPGPGRWRRRRRPCSRDRISCGLPTGSTSCSSRAAGCDSCCISRCSSPGLHKRLSSALVLSEGGAGPQRGVQAAAAEGCADRGRWGQHQAGRGGHRSGAARPLLCLCASAAPVDRTLCMSLCKPGGVLRRRSCSARSSSWTRWSARATWKRPSGRCARIHTSAFHWAGLCRRTPHALPTVRHSSVAALPGRHPCQLGLPAAGGGVRRGGRRAALRGAQGQLEALHLLLQSQACCGERADDPALKALGQFNALLLKSAPGGRTGALHQLLDAAKVGRLLPGRFCRRCPGRQVHQLLLPLSSAVWPVTTGPAGQAPPAVRHAALFCAQLQLQLANALCQCRPTWTGQRPARV